MEPSLAIRKIDNSVFEQVFIAEQVAYQAQKHAEMADHEGNEKASFFRWGEAIKKAIAVSKKVESIEKIFANTVSQQLSVIEEDLSKDSLEMANELKTNWSAMQSWYTAKERTAAGHLARRAILISPENKGLKNSLIRCTKEAAEAWAQTLTQFQKNSTVFSKKFKEIARQEIPLQECQNMAYYWNCIAEATQMKYKEFLEAEALEKAETLDRISKMIYEPKALVGLKPSPLNALSEKEKEMLPNIRFLEGKDIPLKNGERKKRVRILETSSAYPYVRTEEIIDEENNVFSRERMVANELNIESGKSFNLDAFKEKMKSEISSIREETFFDEPFYILRLKGYSIDFFERVQKKIKLLIEQGEVSKSSPTMFMGSG